MSFWAAVLKGTKSCRTQGDFALFACLFFVFALLSVHPFICLSVPPFISLLRSSIGPLRPCISSRRPQFRSEVFNQLSQASYQPSQVSSQGHKFALSAPKFFLSDLKLAQIGPIGLLRPIRPQNHASLLPYYH